MISDQIKRQLCKRCDLLIDILENDILELDRDAIYSTCTSQSYYTRIDKCISRKRKHIRRIVTFKKNLL